MTLAHLMESEGPVVPAEVEVFEIPVLTELLGIVPVDYICGWCRHPQGTLVWGSEHPKAKCGYCQTENKFHQLDY